MEALFSNPNVWLIAFGIFAVRVLNMAVDTIRMLTVMRALPRLQPGAASPFSLTIIAATGPTPLCAVRLDAKAAGPCSKRTRYLSGKKSIGAIPKPR